MNKIMKFFRMLFSLMILLYSISFSQSQWLVQNREITGIWSSILYGVCFTDSNKGIVVGDYGQIFSTTNGGQTWSFQNSNTSNDLYWVQCIDTNTATVVGGEGTILKTTNAGKTWMQQTSGTSKFLAFMFFVNRDVGTIVGEGGTILRTTDGGLNWIPQNSGSIYNLYGVFFTDINTGTVVSLGGEIIRTTDGGQTWVKQNSGTSDVLLGIYFTDKNTGTAVGYGGLILRTTDGGQTWIPQNSGVSNWLRGISFTDTYTGFVAGQGGMILKTTDAGQTWYQQTSGVVSDLLRMDLLNSNYGYAVGREGVLLHYFNYSGNIQIISPKKNNSWMAETYNNIIWTSNNIAKINIDYSSDGGLNWNAITQSIPASDAYCLWLTPQKTSNTMKIRLSDALYPVKSINSNTFTVYSQSSSIPVALKASALTQTSFASNWETVTNAQGYFLDVAIDFQFENVLSQYNNRDVGNVNSFTVTELTPNLTYYYRIRAYNLGNVGANSNIISVNMATGINKEDTPLTFNLFQNYPNPFNPTTKIKFDIPEQTQVKLTIYDNLGREVAILVNKNMNPGSHEITFDGSKLTSGVYFCRIQAKDFISMKKLILIK